MSDERVYGSAVAVEEMAERMVAAQREHYETMAYQHAKDGCPYLDTNIPCPYCTDDSELFV